MDDFYRCWFSGVEDFLNNEATHDGEIIQLLSPCAKRCSDSYPLGVYRKAFADGVSIEAGLKSLKELFGDSFEYEIFADRITLSYKNCSCMLVTDKLVSTARLCKCSELSLQYIWESLYGKQNVRVTTVETILRGDPQCRFEIKVRQLGHFELMH